MTGNKSLEDEVHSQKTQQEILYLVQCHWFSSVSNLTTKETTFKKKWKKKKDQTTRNDPKLVITYVFKLKWNLGCEKHHKP